MVDGVTGPVSDEEHRSLIESPCGSDAWILDHAYGAWKELPLKRADVVVGLDYPRWVSLWRVTRRSLLRATDKRPVCNGNVETWGQVFSRESMIVWHFRSFRRKRDRIRAWAQQSPGPQIIWLRSPQQTARWLGTLERAVHLRRFLVDEPFALQPERVDEPRDSVVGFVQRTVPDPVTGATLALEALSGTPIADAVGTGLALVVRLEGNMLQPLVMGRRCGCIPW